jgi:hypothetical protein
VDEPLSTIQDAATRAERYRAIAAEYAELAPRSTSSMSRLR